jgi:hypothetical protein
MEDAIDGHLSTNVFVKDGIWKPLHQSPTIFLVNLSVEFKHATNHLDTSIHAA